MPTTRDISYANDPRVTSARARPPVLSDPETDEERTLPWRWEVCDLCHGAGTHVNPSIDAHGLTAEDFAENPEFREDYLSGAYDVPCTQCGGRTTVPVLDEDRCEFADAKAYYEQEREAAQARRDEARAMALGY